MCSWRPRSRSEQRAAAGRAGQRWRRLAEPVAAVARPCAVVLTIPAPPGILPRLWTLQPHLSHRCRPPRPAGQPCRRAASSWSSSSSTWPWPWAIRLSVPLGEAPDEADHYNVHHLPGHEAAACRWDRQVTQGKHPPLYHAAAATLSAWTGLDFTFLRSNPDAVPLGPDKPPNFFVHTTLEAFPWRGGALAMHLARLLSVALGAVTLWAAWRLGLEVFPDRPAIGLISSGLPGWPAGLPVHQRLGQQRQCRRRDWRAGGAALRNDIAPRAGLGTDSAAGADPGAGVAVQGGHAGAVAAGCAGGGRRMVVGP